MDAFQLQKLIEDHDLDIFSIDDLVALIGEPYDLWRANLRTLHRVGYLVKLEKGKYCKHNFTNHFAIGTYMGKQGIIAYWSALSHHGLTNQIPNTVFVQTLLRKKKAYYFNTSFEFFTIDQADYIGFTTEGHGCNSFLVTSKEKSMIDCINKPLLSGDYPAVIHAIANHKINVIDTLNLCQKMNNGGAIKRLGYLFEMFQIDGHEAFTDFATNNLPSGYILLDPSGYDEGSYSNKWGLRLNITKDDLLSIKDNLY